MEFKGVYTVLLTAFKEEDKSFDEDTMRSHIDRVLEPPYYLSEVIKREHPFTCVNNNNYDAIQGI